MITLLKDTRTAMHLTQIEMAEVLGGIHPMTLSRAERGFCTLNPFWNASLAMMKKNLNPDRNYRQLLKERGAVATFYHALTGL